MYEIGKINNSAGESVFNLYNYMNSKKSSLLESTNSPTMNLEIGDDCSAQKIICNTENTHEKQVIIEKLIEYYGPATSNYKFFELFDKQNKFEFPRRTSDCPYLSRSSTHIDFLTSRVQSDNIKCVIDSNTSRRSLKLARSKSVIHLKSSYPECMKKKTNDSIKKYSKTFLNSELALQELNQQNVLAQELVKKYFKEDLSSCKPENQSNGDKAKILVNQEENKSLHSVSSLLSRYYNHIDKNEQVCLKPSDEYIFMNDNNRTDLNKGSKSVKFVRPFKYYTKNWDSGSNVMFPFQFEGPSRKRTRLEFESNIALNQDTSTDTSLKTENVQFLAAETKRCRKSDSQQNKVLYKTDSKNFENTYSYEELQDFMPERYMSLRNLYGGDYIETMQEQVNKPRYHFQTLPNKNNKSRELVVKFFDSGSHIKITDDDYKKWLKEKNYMKYSNLAKSSVSSITFRSVSQKIVNYYVAPVTKPNYYKSSRTDVIDRHHQFGFNKLTDSCTRPSFATSFDNYKFVDLEYNNLYQLFLYEHIVISNAINVCISFNVTRIKKLTILDRMYQLIFLLFCYYVLSLINNKVFDQHNENWF